MKYLKLLLTLTAFSAITTITAQTEEVEEVTNVKLKDVEQFTVTKKYTTSINGKETAFRIKEYDLDNKSMKDASYIKYVNKEIYIDADNDKYYDTSLVIRYMTTYEGKFEIVPVKNGDGIGVKAGDAEPIEITKAGLHLTDEKDNDYFIVQEYRKY